MNLSDGPILCVGCKQEVDPDYCWCGSELEKHDLGTGHHFVMAGCNCPRHVSKEEHDALFARMGVELHINTRSIYRRQAERHKNMNSYKLPDGRTFRVVGSNILVERIKLPQVSAGGIIIRREKEDATAIGIVRAVGHITTKKGKAVPIENIVPGTKVAFLWFHAERHTNQQIRQRIGDDFVLLKWEDISLAWDPTEHYEISDIISMGA